MALVYLKRKNIMHRDIEPNKILFKPFVWELTHEKLEIKLIDFGLAKKTTDNDLFGMVGDPLYTAPEIYKNESSNFNNTGMYNLFTIGKNAR